MLIDDLFYRLVRRFRRSQNQESHEHFQSDEHPHTQSRRSKGGRHGHGAFSNSRNFVVDHPTFIENQAVMAGKPILSPVLEYILPYTDLNATVDSSARYPPPLCHPGTRLKIRGRLDGWLANPNRQWNMIWLHGPAGTGKSAVAQSFAEHCVENGRLGASFFFSRPNQQNNPDTVIPTLVYQLAVHNRDYKSLVAALLADDPGLMQKARHIQLKKLIVEPISQIQKQRRGHIQEPLLIVLDGLDECKGENAQREIIEMISEATRLKKDLPLLWLICSRPEAHLKFIFSRADYNVNCGREELVIDTESIPDVDLYIQDGLAGIWSHFEDITTPTWPSQAQINELLAKACGHFGFASTALRYIGDEVSAAPMVRFSHLLSFLGGATTGAGKSPMGALDALYAGILRDIPDEALHTVKQILGFHIFTTPDRRSILLVQTLCNFLGMDQATFYSAFRKLHSVIDVPTPRAALQTGLRFYHASFSDYLRDPHRSGSFISESDAWLNYAIVCLSWYKIDTKLFHTADGFNFDGDHQHGILPDLKWISEDNGAYISSQIAHEAAYSCWLACDEVTRWDALLPHLRKFDFRYMWHGDLGRDWMKCMDKLWEVGSSSGFIRTEPQSEVDLRLLDYMRIMTESGKPVKPAKFPFGAFTTYGHYFLLGSGPTAVVCWSTGLDILPEFVIQNCNEAPPKKRINAYQAFFTGQSPMYDSDIEGFEV